MVAMSCRSSAIDRSRWQRLLRAAGLRQYNHWASAARVGQARYSRGHGYDTPRAGQPAMDRAKRCMVGCARLKGLVRGPMAKLAESVLVVIALAAVACGAGANSTPQPGALTATGEGGKVMSFTIASSVFHNGQAIPSKYSCDGDNVSV